MKRFLAFANGNSRGGWNDFRGDFDTADEAREHIWNANKRGAWTWAHVFDTKERKKLHVRLQAPTAPARCECGIRIKYCLIHSYLRDPPPIPENKR